MFERFQRRKLLRGATQMKLPRCRLSHLKLICRKQFSAGKGAETDVSNNIRRCYDQHAHRFSVELHAGNPEVES
jgi:hypothetical protein